MWWRCGRSSDAGATWRRHKDVVDKDQSDKGCWCGRQQRRVTQAEWATRKKVVAVRWWCKDERRNDIMSGDECAYNGNDLVHDGDTALRKTEKRERFRKPALKPCWERRRAKKHGIDYWLGFPLSGVYMSSGYEPPQILLHVHTFSRVVSLYID